ncbi:15410_t:CDS:1, partial [Racocetra fulgida]
QAEDNKSTIATKCFITSTKFPSDQENLQTTDMSSTDSTSLEPMILEEPEAITSTSDVKTTEVIKKDLVKKPSEISILGKRKERENDYEQNPVNKQKLNKMMSKVRRINDTSQEHISTEQWQVPKDEQTALSNPIIINQFSNNTPKIMVNDQSVSDFCQINIASNDQNYDENSTTVSLC